MYACSISKGGRESGIQMFYNSKLRLFKHENTSALKLSTILPKNFKTCFTIFNIFAWIQKGIF